MSVSTEAIRRGLDAVDDACARAVDGEDLFARVSDRLRTIVPYDGSAWFATDPTTVLATAPVRIENTEDGHCGTFWERECRVEDALLFRDVARSPEGAGTLHQATGNDPGRSARYREFLAPQGYDDELRAAFRTGESAWGVLDLYREQGRPDFTTRELDVVRAVGPVIAAALRALATRVTVSDDVLDTPGTALYDLDGRLLSLDEQAEHWLTELAGPHWADAPHSMSAVSATVARAPVVLAGRERGPASARMRTAAGRWLMVQASCLRSPDGSPGSVAVTIGPAKSAQIAPIIVEAYGLTTREQEITQSVARGLSNAEVAGVLHISPHTVRDHLKAIFTKAGVGTRGELVAKLFAEHYGPRLHQPGAAVHAAF